MGPLPALSPHTGVRRAPLNPWPSTTISGCRRGSSLDLDAAAAARLAPRCWYGDFEHTVTEVRVGLVGLDAFRERDVAMEAAVGALTVKVALPVLLMLLAPLAADRDGVVRDLNLDVV